MSLFRTCPRTNRTDRTGKVFVVNQGMRTCLVCNQEFSRQESAEHAKVLCYPVFSDPPSRETNQVGALVRDGVC